MLCPEVWNFQEPASYFNTQILDSNEFSTLNKIKNFHFNHLASVILPDTIKIPDSLTDTFDTDCDYYKISNLNVQDLLDIEFLNCFINSGQVTLLSINNRIDCDICLCITPTGHLILNIDKENYQKLGLQGKVSHFNSKDKSRYVIDIDLTKPNSASKRTRQCLSKLPKKTVIFNWKPPEENICPSSVASYFSSKYKIQTCKMQKKPKLIYTNKVPDLSLENSYKTDIHDFIEWLGMISLEADFEVSEDYVSSYKCPEPNLEIGQVRLYEWKGLFTFDNVKCLVQEVQEFVNSANKPWGAIYIQGFSDSPIAWSHQEHHYFTNGDNGYVIFVKDNKYLVCTQECSKKVYK